MAAGIERPWRHQVQAAEAAWAGGHVALATGTASGKSLGYLLPVLAAGPTGTDDASASPVGRHVWTTALYLSPTKALAHDQLRAVLDLAPKGWAAGALDGDSTPAERDWAREYAAYVHTNPDMLHLSMLPNHARWAAFLRRLRFVVVDEAHRYRGVFGAQVAAVLRRLRRLARHYGASPVFVFASATVADAGEASARLIGVDAAAVTVVDEDTSTRGPVEVLFRQPEGAPEDDAARLLATEVEAGRQAIAFVGSRRSAEAVALAAQRLVGAKGGRIAAYRGGYLAEDRRDLERQLQLGQLRGAAATNALELGVDISGVDSVILSGFPGSRAAFWQQAGRAGRRGRDATVVFLARPHPLDRHLIDHPEWLFDRPVEASVLHPQQPYVLGPQLAAAAQELPLTEADFPLFGPTAPRLIELLTSRHVLRRRPDAWYWTAPDRAVDRISLRSSGESTTEIIEVDTGRVLGQLDDAAADAAVHPGAVYLHRGEIYLSESLGDGEALVRAAQPGYLTQPRCLTELAVQQVQACRRTGPSDSEVAKVSFGEVELRSQVRSYLRRDELTGTVWDETPLNLPMRSLRTAAVWWSIPAAHFDDDVSSVELGGGAHAVEHLLVGLLPLVAPCDRWDVGGLVDVNTAEVRVFVHDRQPGGAGYAALGYAMERDWLRAALDRVATCGCEFGCPSCIVSAECSRPGQPLNKEVGLRLLRLVVA